MKNIDSYSAIVGGFCSECVEFIYFKEIIAKCELWKTRFVARVKYQGGQTTNQEEQQY